MDAIPDGALPRGGDQVPATSEVFLATLRSLDPDPVLRARIEQLERHERLQREPRRLRTPSAPPRPA